MSELSWVAPDACTLPTAEQPLRVAEFDDLFVSHLREVELVGPQWARMHFAGPAGIGAVVRDLADRESACCSFFEFSVTTSVAEGSGEAVRLDVHVPPERADVLAAFAARAGAALET